MNQFETYAYYYDLFYQEKNYEKESARIHSLITRYKPNAKTILDLGCGTGKHAIFMAENGYDVIGVDISESMLAQARENSEKKSTMINFIHADIACFESFEIYDVAMSMFHVLSYQDTDERFSGFFNTIDKHLRPSGLLIVDFWYGPAVMADPPERRIKNLESETLKLTRIATPQMSDDDNIIEVDFEFVVLDKKTNEQISFTEKHTMRYFFDDEIAEVTASSFRIETSFLEDWGKTIVLLKK